MKKNYYYDNIKIISKKRRQPANEDSLHSSLKRKLANIFLKREEGLQKISADEKITKPTIF